MEQTGTKVWLEKYPLCAPDYESLKCCSAKWFVANLQYSEVMVMYYYMLCMAADSDTNTPLYIPECREL